MRLWIRADASAEIGLGHVMRTLALAETARAQGDAVSYVCARQTLTGLPRRYGFDVHVVKTTSDHSWLKHVLPGESVVFDGYSFTVDDLLAAKASGAVVGVVDDL